MLDPENRSQTAAAEAHAPMRKPRHLRALVLPVTATILIPTAIIALSGAVSIGWGLPSPFDLAPPLLGLASVGVGLLLLIKTVVLFGKVGEGTLAPWDPTQSLVVRGVYRYVRTR